MWKALDTNSVALSVEYNLELFYDYLHTYVFTYNASFLCMRGVVTKQTEISCSTHIL